MLCIGIDSGTQSTRQWCDFETGSINLQNGSVERIRWTIHLVDCLPVKNDASKQIDAALPFVANGVKPPQDECWLFQVWRKCRKQLLEQKTADRLVDGWAGAVSKLPYFVGALIWWLLKQ